MNVSFGNLTMFKPSLSYDNSEGKLNKMALKLSEAGFTRVDDTDEAQLGTKRYHIYSLPYKVEFSSDVDEAIEIMKPYSKYMQPLMVVG